MEKFFNPRSIAVIGASEQEGKIGNILLKNLLELNYHGTIYPINPKHSSIEGLSCYASVLDIPEPVDLAIVAIPARFVPEAVEQCAQRSDPITTIIVISAGFSEAGEEGKSLEQQLKVLAQNHNLLIAGPNCLGMVNALENINASFSKNNFLPGKIGLIMQSGAFTTALFDLAKGENIGFSLVATLGNKAILDEIDFMRHFLDDPRTEIIGLYLEDIKRGKEFCQTLREVSRTKPVVILKAGNSQKARQAMLSHTGAMAGEADVAREAIEENGGLYFDNLSDFLDALKVLSGYKVPRNKNMVILTNAGGPGVIVTDNVERNGMLKMMEISPEQKEALKEQLPEAASVGNPIDVLGDADEERYARVLAAMQPNDEVGAVLAIVTPQAQTRVADISQELMQANKIGAFPVYPVVIGFEADKEADSQLAPEGMSNFMLAAGLIGALEVITSREEKLSSGEVAAIDQARQERTEGIFTPAKEEARSVFYYAEALELAQQYGIPGVGYQYIADEEELASTEIAFPIVMKIDDPQLVHKNAKSGVVLNLSSQEELVSAYRSLRERFATEKVLIQHQERSGFEMIIGIKRDEKFGHVLMLGFGGILTELIGKKLLWTLPCSREDLVRKIEQRGFGKLFDKQRIDRDSVLDLLEKVSSMAMEHPEIKELDINPVLFYADKGPMAVDIKVMI